MQPGPTDAAQTPSLTPLIKPISWLNLTAYKLNERDNKTLHIAMYSYSEQQALGFCWFDEGLLLKLLMVSA